MSEPYKKQHYVQKAILNSFGEKLSKNSTKIKYLDLSDITVKNDFTSNVFCVKNLYNLNISENDKELEQSINKNIETPMNSIRNKIANSNDEFVTLSNNEILTIKKYCLMQIYRNPINISHVENMCEDTDYIGKTQKHETESNLDYLKREMLYICENDLRNENEFNLMGVKYQTDSVLNSSIMIFRTPYEFVINDLGYACEMTYVNIKTELAIAQATGIEKYMYEKYHINNFDSYLKELEMNNYNIKYELCTILPISYNTAIIFLNKAWNHYTPERAIYPIFSSRIVNKYIASAKKATTEYSIIKITEKDTLNINFLLMDTAQKILGFKTAEFMIKSIDHYVYNLGKNLKYPLLKSKL